MDLKNVVFGMVGVGLGTISTSFATLPVIGTFGAPIVTLFAAFEAYQMRTALLKPALTKEGLAKLSIMLAFGLVGLAGILSMIGMANPLAGWSAAGFAALGIILSLL
jgi:hypothetical protein